MADENIAKPIVSQHENQEPKPEVPEEVQEAVKPQVEQPPEDESIKFHEGYYRHSPLFYEVAKFYGVEEEEYDAAKDNFSVLVDWAIEEGKSTKLEDILYELRRLEENMQPPEWGERRYKKAYAYVRLLSQKKSVEKAMKAYEKNFQKEEVKEDGE